MTPRAILTDLDGTLLEPDGTLSPEARQALAEAAAKGVPVVPITSKTAAEVAALLPQFSPSPGAGLENGGAVLRPDGTLVLSPQALPLAQLQELAAQLRRATGVALATIFELGEEELAQLTQLPPGALPAMRRRLATLPLVVERKHDQTLRQALSPPAQLVRGNRFLHLQGPHSKASVLPQLLESIPGAGPLVALGDAPNDVALLLAADVAVVVPGFHGPNPQLLAAVPGARVAPLPHGRGWAAVVQELLAA